MKNITHMIGVCTALAAQVAFGQSDTWPNAMASSPRAKRYAKAHNSPSAAKANPTPQAAHTSTPLPLLSTPITPEAHGVISYDPLLVLPDPEQARASEALHRSKMRRLNDLFAVGDLMGVRDYLYNYHVAEMGQTHGLSLLSFATFDDLIDVDIRLGRYGEAYSLLAPRILCGLAEEYQIIRGSAVAARLGEIYQGQRSYVDVRLNAHGGMRASRAFSSYDPVRQVLVASYVALAMQESGQGNRLKGAFFYREALLVDPGNVTAAMGFADTIKHHEQSMDVERSAAFLDTPAKNRAFALKSLKLAALQCDDAPTRQQIVNLQQSMPSLDGIYGRKTNWRP